MTTLTHPTLFRPTVIRVAITVLLMALCSSPAFAQQYNFTVLHNFAGLVDGSYLPAGLSIDSAGNLYGATCDGGSQNFGTVFELVRNDDGWSKQTLYDFRGGTDGSCPTGRVVFGPDGNLYGTTEYGGYLGSSICNNGCGTVFQLKLQTGDPQLAPANWTETVLYRFQGGSDGTCPGYGDVSFDQAGNLYGTTVNGGLPQTCSLGCGTVYELTPGNGSWPHTVLYRFENSGGQWPYSGVAIDAAGSLYGTTIYGGYQNHGVVYQLVKSGNTWTENLLHVFRGAPSDGSVAYGGLIFDASGNLFAATSNGGTQDVGTVYELSPFNGGWQYSLLYSIRQTGDGAGPWNNLVMDRAGNLYGATTGNGYRNGEIFELSPSGGGGWTEKTLHVFSYFGYDGDDPIGNPVLDTNGNLYGTTFSGGEFRVGVAWEVTP